MDVVGVKMHIKTDVKAGRQKYNMPVFNFVRILVLSLFARVNMKPLRFSYLPLFTVLISDFRCSPWQWTSIGSHDQWYLFTGTLTQE